ncbi:extracellular ligand-gated ion channel [Aureococcus anophagefferens]|nr:extracellular ligand-gated ion channel [Aureococcus anophagefferens]
MAPGASRLALLAAAAAASPTAAPTGALCGVTVGNRTNLDTGGLKAAWEALGYDRTLRPLEATTGSPNAPPELVQVGALLLGFSLDEANTNWSPRYFQRTQWVDPRLAYDVPAGCDVAYVYLGAYEWRTYLWRPIPYVKNLARWVDGHQLAGGIWVYPDGTVFESRLVNDELTCRLDVTNCVTKMPFDTQKCEIVYGMYINDETSVQLRLLPQAGGPVEIDDAKYNVQNTWKLGPRRGWETLVMYLGGSQFMEVTLQVEVYRRSAYYVSTVMIPCVLFLFIQYAGFFVDRHVAPARVAISVVPVLIMLTLSSDVFEKIQRVSYSVYLVSFVNLASYITWACTLHYGLVQYFLSHEHAGTARRLHLVRIQSIDESALPAARAAGRAARAQYAARDAADAAAASTSALPPPPIVSLDILAEVFHRHDRNGDGVIDEAEMRMALRHYSIFCSAAHAGLEIRAYHPACESNLQPDFNVREI